MYFCIFLETSENTYIFHQWDTSQPEPVKIGPAPQHCSLLYNTKKTTNNSTDFITIKILNIYIYI